jgi:S-(hydroxymethyl)glutathione dehydrogenase / alcohol dehydrogenase
MKIAAAVLNKINKHLVIEELLIPKLKPGQVLIKVAYSGVCHSQLNEIRGLKGEDKYLPHTLGHEGSGEVIDVGSGVTKVKVGNHVVMTWIKSTGMEVPMTIYHRRDGSTVNSGAISTFSNYTVVSENRIVPVDKDYKLDVMALLGCAIPTGAGIAINTASINFESKVAIFGVGGIGLSSVLGCKLSKAKNIIAIDIVDHKLKLAQDLGCTHIINSRQENPFKRIMELTDGQGVDCSIEASGNKQIMETAFKSIKCFGGLCIIAGNLPQGKTISIDPMELIKGKSIVGTWGGGSNPDKDIPLYASLHKAKEIDLEKFLTHTYALSEINKAFEDLEQGKVVRAMVDMSLS